MGETRLASAGECGDGGEEREFEFYNSISYFVVKGGTNILQYHEPDFN